MRESKFKLKKVKPMDLQVFKSALNHHIHFTGFLFDTLLKKKSGIDCSIAIELFFSVNSKTQKQDIPEKTTLKFSMHQAIVFCEALKEYEKASFSDSLERSICSNRYVELDMQIPTPGQLLLGI